MGEETPSEASDLSELATLVAQIAGVIEQGMVLTRPMVTRISPSPGTAASQCKVAWENTCSLLSEPMKMPSSESTSQLSTATVMASGEIGRAHV